MSDDLMAATAAELEQVISDAVDATELPVTRRREAPGLLLDCDDGTERLAAKVNADDPAVLEPLADALVAHLESQGWTRVTDLDLGGDDTPSTSVYLERDGFEAIVDLVRGTQGTGIDLEVISPCRDLSG